MLKDRGNKSLSLRDGGVVAEGVSFDGVSDYMSRSTDLVGNVDSKTFTFSCWVYGAEISYPLYSPSFSYYVQLYVENGLFKMYGYGGTTVRLAMTAGCPVSINTWNHILVSVDLANTANRYVYINDVPMAPSWGTYSNVALSFTDVSGSLIFDNTGGRGRGQGRLSNLFLDYTYRDLSIEANRRLFITADGKPA